MCDILHGPCGPVSLRRTVLEFTPVAVVSLKLLSWCEQARRGELSSWNVAGMLMSRSNLRGAESPPGETPSTVVQQTT